MKQDDATEKECERTVSIQLKAHWAQSIPEAEHSLDWMKQLRLCGTGTF